MLVDDVIRHRSDLSKSRQKEYDAAKLFHSTLMQFSKTTGRWAVRLCGVAGGLEDTVENIEELLSINLSWLSIYALKLHVYMTLLSI